MTPGKDVSWVEATGVDTTHGVKSRLYHSVKEPTFSGWWFRCGTRLVEDTRFKVRSVKSTRTAKVRVLLELPVLTGGNSLPL